MCQFHQLKFGGLLVTLSVALVGCRSGGSQRASDLIAANKAPRTVDVERKANADPGTESQKPQVSLVSHATIHEEELPEHSFTALQPDNSLAALEQIALANNPTLIELTAKVDALRGKWVQVGLRPNTHVGFSGQQLFSDWTEEQIGVVIGQKIVRAPKLDWNQRIVCHEIDQAQQRLHTQQQRVLTDVRLGFYEVLINQRRVGILHELTDIATQSLSSVETLRKAGEATKIDTLRATVEQQAIQVQLQNAQTTLSASWSRLATVLGMPELPQSELIGDMVPTPIEMDRDALLSSILEQSPEVAAAMAEQERARAAWHRANVESLPDFDVESTVQHDYAFGGANANLQVTFPIPWRDWNQGGIHQARSEWFAAQQSVAGVALSIQQRLATAWQNYSNARQQVENYSGDDGIIDNSKQTLDLIARAYSAGEVGFLDLLTAQRTFAQTNLLYLDALSQLWASRIELDGLLLKGSL